MVCVRIIPQRRDLSSIHTPPTCLSMGSRPPTASPGSTPSTGAWAPSGWWSGTAAAGSRGSRSPGLPSSAVTVPVGPADELLHLSQQLLEIERLRQEGVGAQLVSLR